MITPVTDPFVICAVKTATFGLSPTYSYVSTEDALETVAIKRSDPSLATCILSVGSIELNVSETNISASDPVNMNREAVEFALGGSLNLIIDPFKVYATPGSWNTPLRNIIKLLAGITSSLSLSNENGSFCNFIVNVCLLLSKKGEIVSNCTNLPK